MLGVMKGLARVFSVMLRRPVTVKYPYQRPQLGPRFMGAPGLLWDDEIDEIVCVACNICARACPEDCIRLEGAKYTGNKSDKKNIVTEYYIDLGRCSYCGICVEVCPFDANEMTYHYEMACYDRSELVYDMNKLVEIARGMKRRYGKEEAAAAPAAAAAAAD